MRLAIVNNQRASASRGLKGFCPVCGGAVIARCGTQRVHHWAHRGARVCDHWWEPETEWHRHWKVEFPELWQEVIQHDATGEKHIADVRTEQALVIEFQHSHIRPEERAARERFYGAMIWVVDGVRLQRDLPRLRDGARSLRPVAINGVYLHRFPEEMFPAAWLNSEAPVFFDFAGVGANVDALPLGEPWLWCLLPRTGSHAIVLKVAREDFVRLAHKNSKALLFLGIPAIVDQWLAAERATQVRQLIRYRSSPTRPAPRRWKSYVRRKRKFTF